MNIIMNNSAKNALLKMVSKKIGVDANKLQKDLENGDLSSVMSGMSDEDNKNLQNALSNPEKMKKIFESKEAQELMKKFQSK